MAKILVVEDEESQRKVLREMLLISGYTTLEAGNGVEGLETALRERPDLILMDVRMPLMDGMAMMHALRQNPWGKHVSIIIFTNYDNTEAQLVQITADQPSYYLLKANTPLDTIAEKIEEVLNSNKKQENTI